MTLRSLLVLATVACSTAAAQVTCTTSARSETLLGGSPGALGVPTLALDGSPVIGEPFALRIEGGAPGSVGFFFASALGAPLPLPEFGAISHLLPPYLLIASTLVDAAGYSDRVVETAALPASLCGAELFVQAAVVDPHAQGSLAVSHARRVVVGLAYEQQQFVLRATVLSHEILAGLLTRGDLDGDGRSDLVIAGTTIFGPFFISTLLSNGDLTFTPPTRFDVPSTVSDLAIADLDADGVLDLATVHSGDDFLRIHLGHGDGTFANSVAYLSGDAANRVEVGDLSSDGIVDLVTVNYQANTVAVFLGTGAGAFAAPVHHVTGAQPIAAQLDDVDADGDLDLVVLASNAATLTVFFGDGLGGLVPGSPFPVGVAVPSSLAALDITGDGRRDLVVGGAVTVAFASLGTGAYVAHTDPALGSIEAGAFCAADDVNGDGYDDLLFGSIETFDYRLGGPSGGLEIDDVVHSGVVYSSLTPVHASGFAVHDFDGDGLVDIVAPGRRLSVVRGEAASFARQSPEFAPSGNTIDTLRVVDLDRDGLAEVVTASSFENFVRITKAHGLDGGSTTVLDMTKRVARFAASDVDHDGNLDVVTLSSFAPGTFDHHVVRRRLADGSYAAPVVNAIPQSNSPGLGHVDGDGVLDVVVYPFGGPLEVYFGRADGTLSTPSTTPPPVGAMNNDGVILVDVDLDGFDDFITRGGVAIGNGDGTFGSPLLWSQPLPSSLRNVEARDVDEDGFVDLLMLTGPAIRPTYQFRRGLGGGLFTAPIVTSDAESSARWATIGDFDGDRLFDLAVVRESNGLVELVVYHGNTSSTFDDPTRYFLALNKAIIAASDLDGDGIDDVVHSVGFPGGSFVNGLRIVRSRWLERP